MRLPLPHRSLCERIFYGLRLNCWRPFVFGSQEASILDGGFQPDMPTLVVARVISVLVFAIGVTVMTLRSDRRETVLFCWSLLASILTWIALIGMVATGGQVFLVAYVGLISAMVSLQWASIAVMCGRHVHRIWFVTPSVGAMLSVVAFGLNSSDATALSSGILSVQLALASIFIICHGASVVLVRTAILMASGYALSFLSAFSHVVGKFAWPELMSNPLSGGAATSLPFVASYLGTILITLSWLAALKDRAEAGLAELAFKDELTGLANRRRFHQRARLLWVRAAREATALSLVLIDIDHFKHVNDQWGHGEGDRVLQSIGSAIGGILPEGSLAARMGGEEFCLLLPGMDARAAHLMSEKLREVLGDRLRLPDGAPVRFSAGIAQVGLKDESVDGLYRRADTALYEAKASGRDCAIISAPLDKRAVA